MEPIDGHAKDLPRPQSKTRKEHGDVVGVQPVQRPPQTIVVERLRTEPGPRRWSRGLSQKAWSTGELRPSAATPEPDVPRFRASGSSVFWLMVIGYQQPGHFPPRVPCCFPIVAMPMQRLKVLQRTLPPAVWGDWVNFYQVSIFELVSTPRAFALLLTEDLSVSGLGEGMLVIPFGPVGQPSVIGRGCSCYFGMPLYFHTGV